VITITLLSFNQTVALKNKFVMNILRIIKLRKNMVSNN